MAFYVDLPNIVNNYAEKIKSLYLEVHTNLLAYLYIPAALIIRFLCVCNHLAHLAHLVHRFEHKSSVEIFMKKNIVKISLYSRWNL